MYSRRRRYHRDRDEPTYIIYPHILIRPGRTTCAYTYTHIDEKNYAALTHEHQAHVHTLAIFTHKRTRSPRFAARARSLSPSDSAFAYVYTAASPPPPPSPSPSSCIVYTRLNTAAARDHAYRVDLYTPDWPVARTREQPPACSARAPPIISVCENPSRTT